MLGQAFFSSQRMVYLISDLLTDGTGLGLFMAKKVIIAEGGSVLFESKENEGSTFGFTFSKNKLEVKVDKDLKPQKITSR